jgi:hypothetical protein
MSALCNSYESVSHGMDTVSLPHQDTISYETQRTRSLLELRLIPSVGIVPTRSVREVTSGSWSSFHILVLVRAMRVGASNLVAREAVRTIMLIEAGSRREVSAGVAPRAGILTEIFAIIRKRLGSELDFAM